MENHKKNQKEKAKRYYEKNKERIRLQQKKYYNKRKQQKQLEKRGTHIATKLGFLLLYVVYAQLMLMNDSIIS